MEALIDLRVARTASPITEASQEALRGKLANAYPHFERQFETQFEIRGGRPQPTPEGRLRGFLFSAPDRRSLVQFRVDGFTYNRLKPYPSWEEILPEAIRLWSVYVETTGPEAVTRPAVRYINRLQLPIPRTGLGQYLAMTLGVPEGYRALMKGFLTRVTLDASQGLSAIVTTASDSIGGTSSISVLLDIDVFSEMELAPDDARLKPMLERLRKLKNDLFFESLTEEAVRAFE